MSIVWNTVVTSQLVLLVATWNCQTRYKNEYAGLLVVHLLPLLNTWLIVKILPEVFSTGITLVDVLQNWVNWFHFLLLEGGALVILINCIIFCQHFWIIQRCYANSFFSFTARLRNSLLIECFPLNYELDVFKSSFNRHLSTVAFF